MTQLMGTYSGMVPRLLLPREAALGWKTRTQWDAARKAASMPFSPRSDGEDLPELSTFTSKGAHGFAMHYRLGAVGWLPSPTGGVLVCWLNATDKGTGELPTAKLAALVARLAARQWRLDEHRVRGAGRHVLAYRPYVKRDLGTDWLELELALGMYEVHTTSLQKTALGKFRFVRLTRLGEQAVAAEVKPPTAAERARARLLTKRAKALKWAATDGGPLICMQESARMLWTGDADGDYERACTGALFRILAIGKTQAIVLGYSNGTTWLELGKGRGMLVQVLASNSVEQMLELALVTAAKPGWKRVGSLDVGDGALRIQDAYSPGRAPEHRVVRFTVPRGRYLVEIRPNIATSLSAQIAPVRLTKQRDARR